MEIQSGSGLCWLAARGQRRQRIKRAHVLVIASRTEGGANVIVEVVTAGVPVIASRISGNVGLLGEDFPGYFTLGNAADCAAILRRAETDEVFYQRLAKACARRAANVVPEREATAIRVSVARAQLTSAIGGLSCV